VLGDHKAGVEPRILYQQFGKAVSPFDDEVAASIRNVPYFGRRCGGVVKRHRQGLSVKVSATDGVRCGEYNRVVRDGINFDLGELAQVPPGGARSTVYLRDAA